MRVIVLLLSLNSLAWSYPQFISHGYQSCMACHYNPFGNGSLSDYGRVVSATAISDRLNWTKRTSEEAIADNAGLIGKKELPDWLRPSLNYRGLYLIPNYGEKDSEAEYFTMNASATLVLKFLEFDKLIFVGQMAYAPRPRALKDDKTIEEYRSREHYIGYRLSRHLGVYAGLMDKVYGIRVADHTAYSRTLTNLAQNDQSHGMVFHYMGEKYEIGFNPFIGNLAQKEDLRQKGVSVMAEYGVVERWRLGLSVLTSASEHVKMNMLALHSRLGFMKHHSLLSEFGSVQKTSVGLKTQNNGGYTFQQAHFWLRRGLYALLTAESVRSDMAKEAGQHRLGPGLQFYPMQRVELRADVFYTMPYAQGLDLDPRTDLMAQMHLWF
jgi:hypothetical protein